MFQRKVSDEAEEGRSTPDRSGGAGRRRITLPGWLCCILGVGCMSYSAWLFPIYVPFFLGAIVMGIIGMTRDRVWSGLILFLISMIAPGALFVGLVLVPGVTAARQWVSTAKERRQQAETTVKEGVLGKRTTTSKFAFKVVSASRRGRVGSLLFGDRPKAGTRYLVVAWEYRNISDSPIGSRAKPRISLVSPSGSVYAPDSGATKTAEGKGILSGLSTETLNPGVKVDAAAVFEVPQEVLKEKGWKVRIDADENVIVSLEPETPAENESADK